MKRLLAALLLLLPLATLAHELKPVFLGLTEKADGSYAVRMKVPQFRDGGLAAIRTVFPADCRREGAAINMSSEDSLLQSWTLHCTSSLAGRAIRIEGLGMQTPDALISVQFANGAQAQYAVSRHHPQAELLAAEAAKPSATLSAYIPIGIEHILLGIDHLLFVFGLVLLWRLSGAKPMALIASVTAFTLAHSITLALSALGGITLPSAPVETLIALSILMLATEIARALRSAPQIPDTLTFRKPWLIAFVFGLLHGFGFAGALADTGLPENARAWALLLFNVGVECGQLAFIAALMLVHAAARAALRVELLRYATLMVWIMGSVSAAWTLDRGWQIFGVGT